MAVKYARLTGGSWTANSTWSTTSGGAADTTVPTNGDDVVFDASSGDVTLGADVDIRSFDATSYTGTFTHSGGRLRTFGFTVIAFGAGMTYVSSATASLYCLNPNTLTTNGKLMPNLGTNSTMVLGDDVTFIDAKTLAVALDAPSGTLNLNGNTMAGFSATSRIFIRASSIGNPRTVQVGGGSFANADFQDVTFSSVANVDLSAVSGGSGDCGGNSITGGGTLTLTPPATQTWSGTVGTPWSANAWTTRVPLPQDDVVVNAAFSAGHTINADMPRLGRNISFAGMTGAPTFANTVNTTSYGSLTLISGMTFTFGSVHAFNGRGAFTLDAAGKTFSNSVQMNAPGGSLALLSDLACNGTLQVSYGGFDANGRNVAIRNLDMNNTNVKSLTMGAGTWTITWTATGNAFVVGANTTVSASLATIVLSGSTSNTKLFGGGGYAYGTLTYTVAGSTGSLNITSANTFTAINFSDTSNARTLILPASAVTTVTDFNVNGTAGKLMSVVSSSSGTPATISKVSGQVASNYLSLRDSAATGGAFWYAGANSTNVSGNSGWVFINAPNGNFFMFMQGGV